MLFAYASFSFVRLSWNCHVWFIMSALTSETLKPVCFFVSLVTQSVLERESLPVNWHFAPGEMHTDLSCDVGPASSFWYWVENSNLP